MQDLISRGPLYIVVIIDASSVIPQARRSVLRLSNKATAVHLYAKLARHWSQDQSTIVIARQMEHDLNIESYSFFFSVMPESPKLYISEMFSSLCPGTVVPFQDPMDAIFNIVAGSVIRLRMTHKTEIDRWLPAPELFMRRCPHKFNGTFSRSIALSQSVEADEPYQNVEDNSESSLNS